MLNNLIVRQLNLQPYTRVVQAMHYFVNQRNINTVDEIWLVQHSKVFTQGKIGKAEHLLIPSSIPVVQSDRGGQITYHGPGQQIMYIMLDLHRRKLGIRALITLLEQSVINALMHFSIDAHSRLNAPGVYVGADKICSLGLRIRQGYSFHGLALNIAMDLSPFMCINPCGYVGLHMTQVNDLSPGTNIDKVTPILLNECLQLLNTTTNTIQDWNPHQYC